MNIKNLFFVLIIASIALFYLNHITSTPSLHIKEGKKIKYIEIVAFKGHDINYSINISNVEHELINDINSVREKEGLKKLNVDPSLCYVARNYSERMAEYDFFAHIDPYTRLDALGRLKEKGIFYPLVGENLAFIKYNQKDYPLAKKVIDLWIESPPHRATMLSNEYSLLGVGVYCKNKKCYITSLYASPYITKILTNLSKDKIYSMEIIPNEFKGSYVNININADSEVNVIIVPKKEDAKAIADLMPHSEIWRNISIYMNYSGFLPGGATLVILPYQNNTSINISLTYRSNNER